MNKQLDILDIITILSFYIAIKNLEENEQQSKILESKLDIQDNEYLKNIVKLLDHSIKQNEIIIKQSEELLKRR